MGVLDGVPRAKGSFGGFSPPIGLNGVFECIFRNRIMPFGWWLGGPKDDFFPWVGSPHWEGSIFFGGGNWTAQCNI